MNTEISKKQNLEPEVQCELSIIVPIYNVGPYLESCLLSLVNQTLPNHLYEIILIDDKSKDNSLQICKEFTKKYKNIKLIELNEHSIGGCGIPSNIGIKIAKGKYIGFIDSDDRAALNMFENLLKRAKQTNADIVIGNYCYLDLKNKEISNSVDNKQFLYLCEESQRMDLLNLKKEILKLSPVPWRKIYKLSLLKENNILFPEEDIFYEDLAFHWSSSLFASKISFLNQILVEHSIQRSGQTSFVTNDSRKPVSYIRLIALLNSFLKNNNFYFDFKIPFANIYLNLIKNSTRIFFSNYFKLINMALSESPTMTLKEIIELKRFRKNHLHQIIFPFFLFKISPRVTITFRTLIISVKTYLRQKALKILT